jgi:hypothetical protein
MDVAKALDIETMILSVAQPRRFHMSINRNATNYRGYVITSDTRIDIGNIYLSMAVLTKIHSRARGQELV